MRDSDSDHRMDDETSARPENSEAHTQQAPVIRLLANPRRVRRA